MQRFSWDELGDEWLDEKGWDRDHRDLEVGEQDEWGWTRQQDQGVVRVFRSDRGHLAIEVSAESVNEADKLARRDCADYADFLSEV